MATTSILATRTSEQYEKAKRYELTEDEPPQVRKYPMCYWDEKVR